MRDGGSEMGLRCVQHVVLIVISLLPHIITILNIYMRIVLLESVFVRSLRGNSFDFL